VANRTAPGLSGRFLFSNVRWRTDELAVARDDACRKVQRISEQGDAMEGGKPGSNKIWLGLIGGGVGAGHGR
jgi:hypothetical protein